MKVRLMKGDFNEIEGIPDVLVPVVLVDQFNQSRAFVLELMVVVILIIELVYFFRGKPI